MNLFKSRTSPMENIIKKNGKPAKADDIKKFLNENEDKIISLWDEYNKTARYSEGGKKKNDRPVPPGIPDKNDNNPGTANNLLVTEKTIAINNGMAGEPYRAIVELPDEKLNNLTITSNHPFDELGFSEKTSELKALTSKEGEAEIVLEYTTKKRLKLKLYINENPRNMWKDIPSLQEYKPDNESFFTENSNHIVLSASRRGRSHANIGTRRDDHILTGFHKDWVIAIVADGAGSAKLSSLGSKVVSETVMAQVKQNLENRGETLSEYLTNHIDAGEKDDLKINRLLYDILVKAAHNALKALYDKAKEINRPVKELSTTLSVALIRKFDFGKFVGAFQVGDGAIAVYDDKSSKVDLLCKLDQGEYKSQTLFLNSQPIFKTSESLMDRVFFKTYEQKNTVFLMTDGIVDPFFNGEEKKLKDPKQWDALWQSISGKVFTTGGEMDKNLLEWMNFYVPGEHDDRSLTFILDK